MTVTARSITVERVYGDQAHHRGYRVLVDRLWPRGIRKENLDLDEWAKDLAPSDGLRRWYAHDVERFSEFSRRYRDELKVQPAAEAVHRIRKLAGRRHIVLLTATKDVDHSGAEVLRRALLRSRR